MNNQQLNEVFSELSTPLVADADGVLFAPIEQADEND